MKGEMPIVTVLLASMGIAFAAFCVWLAVRIIKRRERWAKWTAFLVLAGLIFRRAVAWEAAALFRCRTGRGDRSWDRRAALHRGASEADRRGAVDNAGHGGEHD